MPTSNPATDTTMYLALELSRSSWLAAARLPGGEKAAMQRMAAGETSTLLAFIARRGARAAAQLGAPIRVVCCFKAGPDRFWLGPARERGWQPL
jgi:transposase